ncbi:recombinase [Lachnospiraceae bacterium]|jgi:DNA invertase Pin-like site-specific DNA recombinase|nr:recombinase [Lachnospiraceae bacterium]
MKEKIFYAAMYLRLSRDDISAGDGGKPASVKAESESIANQRELIRAYICEQPDIELYDIYADDGFSGSNFDRPEFKRMMRDIEAGGVNCVIVKDLSRFGRDYIEAGRYIQKTFPALGVRFIALTDHYDSLQADMGESSIVLPVKNFINDSYCRDISTKVKSGLEVKRKNGEYISPFAVYGYRKDKENRNRLVVDEYAAGIVRKIFAWKIAGMAVAAIAEQLNGLGILSPKEYKKSLGLKYNSGFSGAGRSLWGSASVKRILTDETYLGHLLQGKTQKVNYKVKKSVEKPKEEWVRVENTHEPLVPEDDFQIVQNLLKSDSRLGPGMEKAGLFAGLLFCGDCKEQMVRRVNRYKGKEKVYYICSTKNRGEGCSRHSIEEEVLKGLVEKTVKKYTNTFLEEKTLFDRAKEKEEGSPAISAYDKEICRLKEEQDRYYSLCSGLYEDLRAGVITKEEFERLHGSFKGKAAQLEEAQKKQESLIKEMFKKGILSAGRLKAFQDCVELKELDRHTLGSLVKRIYVYEDRRIKIEYYFMDQYRVMLGADIDRADGQQAVHDVGRGRKDGKGFKTRYFHNRDSRGKQ